MTVGDPALAEFEKVKKINNQLAIDHYTGMLKKNPKDAETYAKRGKAYAALRDYASATKDYNKAIELDPKTTEAYVGRAVSRYMEKNYDGSWEDVHKAESLGGEFWPAFMDGLKANSKRDK
jgi:tetratricopeptide (TPR) repeat protein